MMILKAVSTKMPQFKFTKNCYRKGLSYFSYNAELKIKFKNCSGVLNKCS